MGIIPLCFKAGEDADTLQLTGHERYTIDLPSNISEIRPGQDVTVKTDNGKSFTCTARFDTEVLPFISVPVASLVVYMGLIWQGGGESGWVMGENRFGSKQG